MTDATLAIWYDLAQLPGWLQERIYECRSGCWEWQWARSDRGYGVLQQNGRQFYAHRLVYSLLAGPIPVGLFLDHLCRNRCCCNPGHLEPVTPAENARRRIYLSPVIPQTLGGRPLAGRPSGDGRWLAIPGWPDYEVSDQGQVRSLKLSGPGLRGRLLKQASDRRGRRMVVLYRDGGHASRYVHRLVAEAFLGPRLAGMETRHLNDVQDDNRLVNLAYGTSSDNKRDMVLNGGNHCASRTRCPKDHPYDTENTYWYKGKRQCRTCRIARSKAQRMVAPRPAAPVRMVSLTCLECSVTVDVVANRGLHLRKYCTERCARAVKLRTDRENKRAQRAVA